MIAQGFDAASAEALGPRPPRSRLGRTLRAAARGLLAGAAIALILLLAYTTLSRIRFPYELEWDEGFTVDSIRRVLDGGALWVAPSVEWLPYPYPPVYTYLSAALSALIGVGFLAPRVVSLAAAFGCLYLTFRLVRWETGSALAGVAASGFLAGTYPLAGTWFDIARVDTLFLFFLLAAFDIVRESSPDRSSVRGSVWAGVMMALAYLTKQTALLPLACLALYCLSESKGWNKILLAAVSGALIAATTVLFSVLTDGWYFYYTVKVPGLHGLGQEQMLVDYWTRDLGLAVAPAALLGVFYLVRRYRERSSDFVFYATIAVGMLGSSWISRLHGGGWLNVLQPAHAMLALLFGLGVAEIERAADASRAIFRLASLVPVVQLGLLFYQPSRQIPTAQDVRNGDLFVQFLRGVKGEVYTPMHGYLPALAGKKTFPHDDYLLTILRTGDTPVVAPLLEEFRDAFAKQRFAAVVIDYEDYRFMDLLKEHYRFAGEVPGSFRPRTGPSRAPQKVYVPRRR